MELIREDEELELGLWFVDGLYLLGYRNRVIASVNTYEEGELLFRQKLEQIKKGLV